MGEASGHPTISRLRCAAFATDADGIITAWNGAAQLLFGRSASEVVAKSWWSLASGASQFELRQAFHAARKDAPFIRDGVRLQSRPGEAVSLVFAPLSGSAQQAAEWIVTCQPSGREGTDLPPNLLEVLPLLAVLDSIGDAVFSVDSEGKVVFYNRAAERTLGHARANVLGQSAAEIPAVFAALTQGEGIPASAKEAGATVTRTLQRANGQSFPAEVRISTVHLATRRYTTLVFRDITEQRQRQQAMSQSQKMLAIGALASGVAHDFNNLLTAILSHLDLVASAELPESMRENMAYAQTSARRGAELVSKLLAFSRQTEPRLEPLDLNQLAQEVTAMLRRSIDRRIQITQELGTDPLWLVEGDSSQLMQVVMNLCINARDAMPEGGELRLRLTNETRVPPDNAPCREATEFVRLTISDTGEGMAPEVLGRLFEPYFTTKAAGKGTGLGLSIAYSVVTEHRGWMEVESEVGRGSQFHVFLPRTKPPAAVVETAVEVPPPEAALEGHERILIVDDDEMVRLVVRAVLNYRGYQVAEAADGEEAVSKYLEAQPRFDLVLLDLNMPRMNGWDALVRIMDQDPAAVIILLSGGLTEGEVERGRALGAAGYLAKPFENPELVRFVRRTLDQMRGADSGPS